MAFFVAIVLLYQFGFDWWWYIAAVGCQIAHTSYMDYRLRELEEKITTTRVTLLDALRGRL